MAKEFISFRCTECNTSGASGEYEYPKRFCIPLNTISEIEEMPEDKTMRITVRFSDRAYVVYSTVESFDELMAKIQEITP